MRERSWPRLRQTGPQDPLSRWRARPGFAFVSGFHLIGNSSDRGDGCSAHRPHERSNEFNRTYGSTERTRGYERDGCADIAARECLSAALQQERKHQLPIQAWYDEAVGLTRLDTARTLHAAGGAMTPMSPDAGVAP